MHFLLLTVVYLEKEYRNTKIGEYLGRLLHSLEVHNVKDDYKNYYYHHSSTSNGGRRKPFLSIVISINHWSGLYCFPTCCKFSESHALAFNIIPWKCTVFKLLWVLVITGDIVGYHNLPLESMNHPLPIFLLRSW